MADRTITALYDTRAAVEDAKQRLADVGVTSTDIHDEASAPADTVESLGTASKHEGFWSKLFGSHEDSHAYAEGLKRGHFLLSAKVENGQTDEAIRVLEATNAIDFDQTQSAWKSAGWTPPASSQPTGAQDTIKLAEERLVVGKREVERGGVRVRSYVVETPVSEQVSLRDEHVSLERHAVDRPVTDAEDAFKERTLSMTETAEEAVVAKEAFVKEELTLNKTSGERTEEINDTVRRTEVEVERLPGSEKTLTPASPTSR